MFIGEATNIQESLFWQNDKTHRRSNILDAIFKSFKPKKRFLTKEFEYGT